MATIVKATSSGIGIENAMSYLRQRLGHQPGEEDAEREPEGGADQRRDDALVADHPARLPAGHPDRPQHPELACALEHAEHERVDHPEQAHDDRERQQHVEEVQEAGKALRVVVREGGAGVYVGVAEVGRRRGQGLVGVRSGVEEGEPVLGLRERLVERLLGDADRAEHLVDLGRVVDASDGDRELVTGRGLDRQRVADRQVVVVGVGLRHERAVGAELGDGGVGAVGPVESCRSARSSPGPRR